jgi:hypothetical protein
VRRPGATPTTRPATPTGCATYASSTGCCGRTRYRPPEQIGDLVYRYRSHGDDPNDARLTEQLANKAVNIPAGADTGWHDPQHVGQAFALAKAALTLRPLKKAAP